MSAKVEFFFDLSSPWTRLAFHNIQPILAETGASVTWRPFLVGGVFNAVNDSVYAGRTQPDAPKNRNVMKWLKEWAALAGVEMNFPTRLHPLKAVTPMRFCCALEERQDDLHRFASASFDAYFRDKRNLDAPDVLVDIADSCGLDGTVLSAAAQSDTVKARLRHNTDEAIERGAFGSPMIFVDDRFTYFGNDQLPLVRQRIAPADRHGPDGLTRSQTPSKEFPCSN
ncbi:MAG TPA: 2-hydroxychromene-2-carboxylate isomerase [Sphingobium sp.]